MTLASIAWIEVPLLEGAIDRTKDKSVEAFGVVATFYFALTYAMVGAFKLVEKRYLRHLAPRETGPAAGRPT